MKKFNKKKNDLFSKEVKIGNKESSFSFTKILIAVFVALMSLGNTQAQDEKTERSGEKSSMEMKKEYQPFKFGAHLKNMHTWHGFQVQSGPMFATNLEYNSENTKFTFGFWGGVSFASTGSPYKEFSTYAVYRFTDKFFVEAVTHNNFTDIEASGVAFDSWTYDRETAYNFLDLNFGYNFGKSSIYYGVILFGQSQDVGRNSDGTLAYDSNGDLTDSWTQYAEFKAQLFEKDGVKLNGIIGGAWSFHTDNTFYTKGKGNIINVGLALSKGVNIGSYKLPVEVMAMWNPERKKTVLQLDITLF